MLIETLELQNFRNYKQLSLRLHPGTNIFYGDNAQGKTNVLEGIFLACTSKSYKLVKDREMIYFGEDEAHLKLQLKKREVPYRIDVHLKKNASKGIAVGGTPIKKASELFGLANVVCFSPEDLYLVKEGPAFRRRFMDMELCQLDKLYLQALVQYNKVLAQRNRLLKELAFQKDGLALLEAWDVQLVHYGSLLIRRRMAFVEELGSLVARIHARLSGGREQLCIAYEMNTEAEQFEAQLQRLRESELRQKTSMVGPHRDDINFCINEVDIRKFGSQGQQRTAALSLKLAEIELVRRQIKDTPILLLDDVLSELDGARQNYLLEGIQDIQTVLTCTGLDDFVHSNFHIDRLFKVVGGTVTQE